MWVLQNFRNFYNFFHGHLLCKCTNKFLEMNVCIDVIFDG